MDRTHGQRSQRLLPQAHACEALIEQWDLAFLAAAQLLNEAGLYSKERGKYPEALPLLEHALTIREKTLGLDHSDTASSLNNLALLYQWSPASLALSTRRYLISHFEISKLISSLLPNGVFPMLQVNLQRTFATRT